MTPVLPLALGLGPPEIILIILVVVLLFGAKKLPELARGSGRALRIFKAETSGLGDDDDDVKTDAQLSLEAKQAAEREAFEAKQAAERDSTTHRDDTTA
jgi:sec-independent protein translocase protein TatA